LRGHESRNGVTLEITPSIAFTLTGQVDGLRFPVDLDLFDKTQSYIK
jgi:hypothetical protein